MKKFSKPKNTIKQKKIKFNYCIILIFLLFSFSFVLAEIDDTKINVKIYTDDNIQFQNDNGSLIGIPIKVEVINNDYVKNNLTFSFTILNGSILNENKEFTYIFTVNDTAENIDFAIDYYECVAEKASINTGYNTCVIARDKCLNNYEGENATLCQDELNTCNLNIQQKDIEITGKQTTITSLENEKEETKNEKFFWGIGGGLLMLVVCLFYFGKIGKGAVKDKSQGEFNPRQQG